MLGFIPHREVRTVEPVREVDRSKWAFGRVCIWAGLGCVEPWIALAIDCDDTIYCRVPVEEALDAAIYSRGKGGVIESPWEGLSTRFL